MVILEPFRAAVYLLCARDGPHTDVRWYAEECLALANKARDPAQGKLFLQMAAARHRLAGFSVLAQNGQTALGDDADLAKAPEPEAH
jgi:hypothetical protein